MGLFAEICGGWTYRKTLWWSWIWNALIAILFSCCGIVVAQKLNKLDWVTNAATGEVDETSEKLVGGLVANISWGIILNALFIIFSVVVLLRKVRPSHRENPRRVQRRTTHMIAPGKKGQRNPRRRHPSRARLPPPVLTPRASFPPSTTQTIAKTGAGFSYGLIVGSAIHMFFAQCEVAIALDSHDKWLKQSLAESTVWASQDNNTYRAMYVLGFLSSISYLIFAVIMIVCMKAVMKESSEPYTEFRDRYGVSSDRGARSSQGP